LADVEIRERTKNARSLDDALRAVARAGGTVRSHWELDALMAYGDAATGIPILREMARAWGFRPIAVDLRALWKRLGVTLYRDSVVFDDTAPLAAVRRAITEAPRP
jgi:predicted metalloprotease with PDZ domain